MSRIREKEKVCVFYGAVCQCFIFIVFSLAIYILFPNPRLNFSSFRFFCDKGKRKKEKKIFPLSKPWDTRKSASFLPKHTADDTKRRRWRTSRKTKGKIRMKVERGFRINFCPINFVWRHFRVNNCYMDSLRQKREKRKRKRVSEWERNKTPLLFPLAFINRKSMSILRVYVFIL